MIREPTLKEIEAFLGRSLTPEERASYARTAS